ncbi:MAG: hypothetical protein MAG715_01159 [Methanonatronarchaeales archaeon]|nr:hypothetical protein [Methanonatronarchaeales archaeon]
MTHKFSCRRAGNRNCNFAVESDEEDELVEMAKRHARETHDAELSRRETRNNLKSIKPAS